MIQFFIYALLAVNVIVCVLLTLVVLMQRPKSEGLGAAFGGGVTDTIFGAQTSDALIKITITLGGAFFVITILMAALIAHNTGNSIDRALTESAAPAIDKATPEALATGEVTNAPVAGDTNAPATTQTNLPAPAATASPASNPPKPKP